MLMAKILEFSGADNYTMTPAVTNVSEQTVLLLIEKSSRRSFMSYVRSYNLDGWDCYGALRWGPLGAKQIVVP